MRDDDVEWCLLHKCLETTPACEPEPDYDFENDPYDDDFNDGDE